MADRPTCIQVALAEPVTITPTVAVGYTATVGSAFVAAAGVGLIVVAYGVAVRTTTH